MVDGLVEKMNTWLAARLSGYFQGNQQAYVYTCVNGLQSFLEDEGISANSLLNENIDLHQFVTAYFDRATGRST